MQKWTKSKLHQKTYHNTVLLLCIWERLFGMHPRYVYIFRTSVRLSERYICSTHKLLVKSTFPKCFTSNPPKQPLRYPLRQSPLKSSISPFFTPSKITTISPKTPSNPYKIRFHSNSTENHIFNKEIIHKNTSIYNTSIQQNTSNINTFI